MPNRPGRWQPSLGKSSRDEEELFMLGQVLGGKRPAEILANANFDPNDPNSSPIVGKRNWASRNAPDVAAILANERKMQFADEARKRQFELEDRGQAEVDAISRAQLASDLRMSEEEKKLALAEGAAKRGQEEADRKALEEAAAGLGPDYRRRMADPIVQNVIKDTLLGKRWQHGKELDRVGAAGAEALVDSTKAGTETARTANERLRRTPITSQTDVGTIITAALEQAPSIMASLERQDEPTYYTDPKTGAKFPTGQKSTTETRNVLPFNLGGKVKSKAELMAEMSGKKPDSLNLSYQGLDMPPSSGVPLRKEFTPGPTPIAKRQPIVPNIGNEALAPKGEEEGMIPFVLRDAGMTLGTGGQQAMQNLIDTGYGIGAAPYQGAAALSGLYHWLFGGKDKMPYAPAISASGLKDYESTPQTWQAPVAKPPAQESFIQRYLKALRDNPPGTQGRQYFGK